MCLLCCDYIIMIIFCFLHLNVSQSSNTSVDFASAHVLVLVSTGNWSFLSFKILAFCFFFVRIINVRKPKINSYFLLTKQRTYRNVQ